MTGKTLTDAASSRAHDDPGHIAGSGRADILGLIPADQARIRRLLATVDYAACGAEPAGALPMLTEAWNRAADLLD